MIRNAIACWAIRRSDVHAARAGAFPTGSLGEARCGWLAQVYFALARSIAVRPTPNRSNNDGAP